MKMQTKILAGEELSEVPSSQRRSLPKSLKEYEQITPNRNSAIAVAYQSGGYTLSEIGDYFGLHYSTVSGIIRNHNSKA